MRAFVAILLLLATQAFAQVSSSPPLLGATGATLPASCAVGQLYFDNDATAGSNVYGCTAANTWTLQGASTVTSGTTATSGCTAGGVLYSASNLVACNDTDLTFNGTTLTATGLTVTNAPTFSALTSGRIPFAGTAGLIGDSANLTYSDTLLFSGPGVKLGTTGTGMGWLFGYGGGSGLASLWLSSQDPTITEPVFKATTTITSLYGVTSVNIAAPTTNIQPGGTLVGRFNTAGYSHGSTPKLTIGTAAPTIASGGCTSPTVTNTNGTAYITIDVGSSCSGSQPVVFTLPAATTGWNCYARNITNGATSAPAQTGAVSTTSVTITNFARTTGVAAAWTDGDDVVVSCLGG